MFSFMSRTTTVILLAGLVAVLPSGCSSIQKSIDPYPQQTEPAVVPAMPPPQVTSPSPGGQQPQGQFSDPGTAGQLPGAAQSVAPEELLPVLTRVDDRIAAYEEKLRAWEGFTAEAARLPQTPELNEKIANCQGRLQAVHATYTLLHDQLIKMGPGQSPDIATMEKLQGVAGDDIGFLESECQRLVAGGQLAGDLLAGSAAKALSESEKALAAAMTAGEYPEAIRLYEQLPAGEGVQPSFESVYSYGQALLRTGRDEDASRVLGELLQDVQQQNQLGREFQLMQLVADIQFGLEDYANAFTGYVNIINRYAGLGENIDWARKQQAVISARDQQAAEVKGFASLMRAYLGFNQARDGFKVVLLAEQFLATFPESSVIPTVNRILFESRDRAEAWYVAHLQQIGQLKDEGRTAEALQLLQSLPVQQIPPDKQAQLQALVDEMTTVQAREAQVQQAAQEATLQEAWNKGEEYLQLKAYDQAIATFSTMLETSYGDRARSRINEAASLAAQEDRQKAAELFVQAGAAKDQAARVDLLLQSRQLLQDILNKYPQSDLGEKVRKNLVKIEQDLRAIDPALLNVPAPTTVANEDGGPANPGPDATRSGTDFSPVPGTRE